jgi:hypothetical protein
MHLQSNLSEHEVHYPEHGLPMLHIPDKNIQVF